MAGDVKASRPFFVRQSCGQMLGQGGLPSVSFAIIRAECHLMADKPSEDPPCHTRSKFWKFWNG
tara:strand:- start:39 stop:230 length:192 start_codon:yes stop_codon:yes gene_type:complete